MLKTYHGSCHCGAGAIRGGDRPHAAHVPLQLLDLLAQSLLGGGDRSRPAFRLLEGKSELKQYLFNSMQNEHYFCKTCGVRPFGVGNSPEVGEMVGVNIGCLEDATPEELAAAPIQYCDGKYDNWQNPPALTSYL